MSRKRKFPENERLTPEQQARAAELFPKAMKFALKIMAGFSYDTRDELLAAAAHGLAVAAARWRPEVGSKFESYAFEYVQGYCLQWFNRHGRFHWNRCRTGRVGAVHDDEDGRICGIDPPGRDLSAPETRTDELEPYLRRLDPVARDILEKRYALDMTLVEIAATMGVTRERVRQLEGRALEKLRGMVPATLAPPTFDPETVPEKLRVFRRRKPGGGGKKCVGGRS